MVVWERADDSTTCLPLYTSAVEGSRSTKRKKKSEAQKELAKLYKSYNTGVADLKVAIDKKDIKRGMVIAAPGTVTPHSKFKAEVYILKKEEGGRHTPFHNKYRPQFYFRTTDVTGEISLEAGREMVMPGDNVTIDVKLIAPIAMDKGLRFAIREGGRTVGAGQVTEILD